jgi:maltose phosphorylase
VTAQTFKLILRSLLFYAKIAFFRKWGKHSYFIISIDTTLDKIQFRYMITCVKVKKSSIKKIGGYTFISLNHKNTLSAAGKAIQSALALGYDQLLEDQKKLVQNLGDVDITIEGDVKAQQEIRLISFN